MRGFATTAGRAAKAEVIAQVLLGLGTRLKILDLGCGSGLIGWELSRRHQVILQDLLDQRSGPARELEFFRELPPGFAGSFEIVLLNHVLSHSEQPEEVLRLASWALAPGGTVYLACVNTLFPREPIYKIPLLHWLPNSVFNRVARFFFPQRHEAVRHLGLSRIKRLARGVGLKPRVITRELIKNPTTAALLGIPPLARPLACLLSGLLPTRVLLLRKEAEP